MTYHTPVEFQAYKDELSGLLISTAADFARSRGLSSMDATALHQMSSSIKATAGELLMFGCDVWPESARVLEPAAATGAAR